MSAKITILFFILICFEIGLLLVILPWLHSPSWNENYFLVVAADKLHLPWLANALKSGYVRGAVTGLGLLNIMLGVWEVINFKKTARAFQVKMENETGSLEHREPSPIPDHRPPDARPGDEQRGTRLPD
jgi:hypothetical protein